MLGGDCGGFSTSLTLQVKDEERGGVFVDYKQQSVIDRAVFKLQTIPRMVRVCVYTIFYYTQVNLISLRGKTLRLVVPSLFVLIPMGMVLVLS